MYFQFAAKYWLLPLCFINMKPVKTEAKPMAVCKDAQTDLEEAREQDTKNYREDDGFRRDDGCFRAFRRPSGSGGGFCRSIKKLFVLVLAVGVVAVVVYLVTVSWHGNRLL